MSIIALLMCTVKLSVVKVSCLIALLICTVELSVVEGVLHVHIALLMCTVELSVVEVSGP